MAKEINMAEDSLPPQTRRLLIYSSAGGGFGGALLAIIVAKLLQGPCCCVAPAQTAAGLSADAPTAVVAVENIRD